jgi:hypothetical protein
MPVLVDRCRGTELPDVQNVKTKRVNRGQRQIKVKIENDPLTVVRVVRLCPF